uniref:PDZ domain-containing protein n=1 Tax=Guillardia theta TaxID=55529 RepID=A0A7S4N9U9_GUITH|mmetsp:Transcript_18531/g.60840  ORF Transcript_18531/g.60840 Transcript_18531/m.60840 type:complete len:803 (+) Transcript_18531:1-2409(+)
MPSPPVRPPTAYSVVAPPTQHERRGDATPNRHLVGRAMLRSLDDDLSIPKEGGALEWLEGMQSTVNGGSSSLRGFAAPSFEEQDKAKRVFPQRHRPSHVTDERWGSSFRPRQEEGLVLPDYEKSENKHEGSQASVGVTLVKLEGRRPVVVDLTPRGREMAELTRKIASGDAIVGVGEFEVEEDTSLLDVERLLVGQRGSCVTVDLLRPFPLSDAHGRREMCRRDATAKEVKEGVVYSIQAVRFCSFLGTTINNNNIQEISRMSPPRLKKKTENSQLADPVQVLATASQTRDEEVAETSSWNLEAPQRVVSDEPPPPVAQLVREIERQQTAISETFIELEKRSYPDENAARSKKLLQEILQMRNEDANTLRRIEKCNGDGEMLLREIHDMELRNTSLVDKCVELFKRLVEAVDGHVRGVKELQTRDFEQLQAQKIVSLQTGLEEQERRQRKVEEELSCLYRQLFNAQRAYDVETARLRLEKMAMEKKMQSQLQVLEKFMRHEVEQQNVRDKLQQHLALLPEEMTERQDLQQKLEELHARRLLSGQEHHEDEGVVEAVEKNIIKEIELLSTTNAELILDLHRIRGENITVTATAAALQRQVDELHEILDKQTKKLAASEQEASRYHSMLREVEFKSRMTSAVEATEGQDYLDVLREKMQADMRATEEELRARVEQLTQKKVEQQAEIRQLQQNLSSIQAEKEEREKKLGIELAGLEEETRRRDAEHAAITQQVQALQSQLQAEKVDHRDEVARLREDVEISQSMLHERIEHDQKLLASLRFEISELSEQVKLALLVFSFRVLPC